MKAFTRALDQAVLPKPKLLEVCIYSLQMFPYITKDEGHHVALCMRSTRRATSNQGALLLAPCSASDTAIPSFERDVPSVVLPPINWVIQRWIFLYGGLHEETHSSEHFFSSIIGCAIFLWVCYRM